MKHHKFYSALIVLSFLMLALMILPVRANDQASGSTTGFWQGLANWFQGIGSAISGWFTGGFNTDQSGYSTRTTGYGGGGGGIGRPVFTINPFGDSANLTFFNCDDASNYAESKGFNLCQIEFQLDIEHKPCKGGVYNESQCSTRLCQEDWKIVMAGSGKDLTETFLRCRKPNQEAWEQLPEDFRYCHQVEKDPQTGILYCILEAKDEQGNKKIIKEELDPSKATDFRLASGEIYIVIDRKGKTHIKSCEEQACCTSELRKLENCFYDFVEDQEDITPPSTVELEPPITLPAGTYYSCNFETPNFVQLADSELRFYPCVPKEGVPQPGEVICDPNLNQHELVGTREIPRHFWFIPLTPRQEPVYADYNPQCVIRELFPTTTTTTITKPSITTTTTTITTKPPGDGGPGDGGPRDGGPGDGGPGDGGPGDILGDCLINYFTLDRRDNTFVDPLINITGAPATLSFQTNADIYCESCEITCFPENCGLSSSSLVFDFNEILSQDISFRYPKVISPQVYTYELVCQGKNGFSDSRTLRVKVLPHLNWREINPGSF